ncbi:hypothetical protein AMTR_s00389p00010880 [Amborella trichopoda]|uniref:Uncharacterized protein n=1 Tax=Amborella trichopoda TaxID=13333 RepID=W1PAA0_AMBTC|nr:hypothetical protein AMTR_s00389p00010880 [Amborella trichopoda]
MGSVVKNQRSSSPIPGSPMRRLCKAKALSVSRQVFLFSHATPMTSLFSSLREKLGLQKPEKLKPIHNSPRRCFCTTNALPLSTKTSLFSHTTPMGNPFFS